MKNKKGLSMIVTTLILILLVLVAVGIVWVFVNNMIRKQTGQSESCFGIYEKVTINNRYTCYDSTNSQFQFSISIADINVDKVIVSVSSAGATNSYELSEIDQENLDSYPVSGAEVVLPEKNSGLTYIASGFTTKPDLIQIAPVIDGQRCEISDSLPEIDNCL